MKKLILTTLAIALIGVFAFAKGTDVPAPVKAKFASLYPTVKKAKWSKEEANFEANFEVDEVETSVVFDASGNVMETESEIKVSDLPKSVTDYCAKTWPGKKIGEAAKLVDGKGVVTYEAEISGVDQIFDANGTFLRSHKE